MSTDKLRERAAEARTWARFSSVILARVYRTMLLTLVAIAVLPLVVSWQPHLIQSGSMQPSIAVGDVALGKPYDRGERVDVGRVYMYQDPSTREERIVVHRIVERRDDGSFTTAGDANDVTDLTPLTPADITARAVLLVPYVGLPVVWAQSGQWLELALWLAFTIAAFFLASRNVDGEPPKWTMRRLILDAARERRTPQHRQQPGDPEDRKRPVAARLAGAVAVTLSLGLVGLGATTATATFTDNTRVSGSTWTAGHWLLPYVKAVQADNPSGFWLLDEPGGRVINDRTGTYPGGTTIGAVTPGQPGALTERNPGTSYNFDGGRGILNQTAAQPTGDYSVELWMRTGARQQQYLAGFEDGTGNTSGDYDRTITMDAGGQIVVGSWTTGVQLIRTVTTPRSYNDGQWHHVVVTATPNWTGLLRTLAVTIYVDGVPVSSGTATGIKNYGGHWRIGGGTVPGFLNISVHRSFSGDMDAVAIYPRALTAQQVANHYAAR